MSKYLFCMAFLICFSSAVPGFSARKEHTRIITVNDYTYEIEVGGFRDPVNETIIIENLGDKPLVNPRITVNGKYDWFDLESIAREATAGCKTDEERAFAIFNFVRGNSHHLNNPCDWEIHDPVVYFNIYGYGNCNIHSVASVTLARVLGMKARVWQVYHHTVNEFWYNDGWHMLDSDIEAYYLMNDNRSVASIEQLWEDQEITGGDHQKAHLTKYSGRTIGLHCVYTDVEGDIGWAYKDSARALGARYYHKNNCFVDEGDEFYDSWHHTMAMTLRPNEKLIRNWKGGPKFYDYQWHNARRGKFNRPWMNPINLGGGRLVWTLNRAEIKDNGFTNNDIFRVRTPYTILGGKLRASVSLTDSEESKNTGFWIGSEHGLSPEKIWVAPENASGSMEVELDLSEQLYPTGDRGRREYSIRFASGLNEPHESPDRVIVDSIELITDIQCAPNSLPALSLGHNIIRYRDETPGPHKVRITHVWRERTDNHPPIPPAGAAYPENGRNVDDLAPLFRWGAAEDPDKKDRVIDYYITISFDPLCRWPISTTLLTETGSEKPEWKLPEGWLNRNTTYYWQVKARDSRGVWGNWSPVFSFKTAE
jgi:Transglutaminase-like superfamily